MSNVAQQCRVQACPQQPPLLGSLTLLFTLFWTFFPPTVECVFDAT